MFSLSYLPTSQRLTVVVVKARLPIKRSSVTPSFDIGSSVYLHRSVPSIVEQVSETSEATNYEADEEKSEAGEVSTPSPDCGLSSDDSTMAGVETHATPATEEMPKRKTSFVDTIAGWIARKDEVVSDKDSDSGESDDNGNGLL